MQVFQKFTSSFFLSGGEFDRAPNMRDAALAKHITLAQTRVRLGTYMRVSVGRLPVPLQNVLTCMLAVSATAVMLAPLFFGILFLIAK